MNLPEEVFISIVPMPTALTELPIPLMVLRSVGHSADRQEFLYRGQDVDKPTIDL